MADEPETPDLKPAPRRRAPRKSTDPAAPRKVPARRKPIAKSDLETIEAAAIDAVRAPVAVVTDGAKKAVKAVKPRSTNRATPRAQAKKDPPVTRDRATEAVGKVGGRWGAAAIAGGLGAAATIALLSLRGSTPKMKGNAMTRQAHQPDGTDSSASFNAGVADENTVPGSEDAPALASKPGTANQPDGTDATASFEAGIADEGTIPG